MMIINDKIFIFSSPTNFLILSFIFLGLSTSSPTIASSISRSENFAFLIFFRSFAALYFSELVVYFNPAPSFHFSPALRRVSGNI